MSAIEKLYTTTYTSTLDGNSSTPTGNVQTNTSSSPSYYIGKYKGIEAFDVCMDFARDSYNIGVAIAYLLRAGKKPENPKGKDLLKAIDHIQKELEYIAYDTEQSNTGADPTKNGQP